jgi:hypothetical protein
VGGFTYFLTDSRALNALYRTKTDSAEAAERFLQMRAIAESARRRAS